MNLRRVWAVAHKEWREIVRDRVYFLLAFILPPVLMLVFGYGVTQEVENVPFALIDEDRSALSRDYAHHYISSRYFDYRGQLTGLQNADRLLVDGRIVVVLVIPARFGEELTAGRRVVIQTLIDGTFTARGRTVLGYVESINAAAAGDLQARAVMRRLGIGPAQAEVLLQPVRVEVRYLYNQELKSIWGVAPAMIMFILILTAPLLAALSVVREKETGAIYNVYASTISRAEYLAGKLAPSVLISFLNGMVLWLMAIWYFDAPFKGSLAFFLPATFVYVVCTSALGLLVSAVARTQQAALMISVILAVVIALSFSGMITPVSSLTGASHLLAQLLPAMYYHDLVLGAFLKGVGWRVLGWEVAALAGFAALMLWATWALFRKRTRQ